MFQFSGFPPYDYGFIIRYMRFSHVGFPIRRSAGQRLFAAHRSLSQLITSFFGSQCQGIRPVLFLLNRFLMMHSVASSRPSFLVLLITKFSLRPLVFFTFDVFLSFNGLLRPLRLFFSVFSFQGALSEVPFLSFPPESDRFASRNVR